MSEALTGSPMPHVRKADSFLGAIDIIGLGDVVCMIGKPRLLGSDESVAGKSIGKKPVVPLFVKGKGKGKELILNVTNSKTLVKLHGIKAEDWEGKWITIYASRTKSKGEEVDCVRIRETAPKPPVTNQVPQGDNA